MDKDVPELMSEWDILDTTRVPSGGGKLTLYKRDERFSIWIEGTELMSSHTHESEDELARIPPAETTRP